MANEKNLITKAQVGEIYEQLRKDNVTFDVLTDMLKQEGFNERQAVKSAEAMMHMVAQREGLCNLLSEDSQKVFEQFLHDSRQMSGYDRKLLLHQLRFGLNLYQDSELIGRMNRGASPEKLFDEYFKQNGENPAITVEVLEKEILSLLGAYRISPEAMRYITKRMEKSKNLLYTSEVLSEEGLRVKCVVAMNLYLHNQKTMTMDEAVNIACTDMDLEALADALAQGRITDRSFHKAVTIAVLAMLLLGFAAMLMAPAVTAAGTMLTNNTVFLAQILGNEAAKLGVTKGAYVINAYLQNIGIILIGGSLLWGNMVQDLSVLLGNLKARRAYVRNLEESRAVEAVNAFANREEEARKAAAKHKEEARKAAAEHKEEARAQADVQPQKTPVTR